MNASISKPRSIQAREQPHDPHVQNDVVTYAKAGALPTAGVNLLPKLPHMQRLMSKHRQEKG